MNTYSQAGDRNPNTAFSAERALYELVDRMAKGGQPAKAAVHIHLSKLQQHRRRDQYIRIATETFENQVRDLGGSVFMLHSFDVVYVSNSTDLLAIEAAVNRLRLLFQEDPLTQFAAEQEQGVFCTWYRLDKDYDKFSNLVRGIYRAAEQSRSLLAQEKEMIENARQNKPLIPEILAKLEQAIAKADLSNVIRSQTVCTSQVNQPLLPMFKELFVNITELQNYVTPGFELRSNRWLFQYLTNALDQRMLSHVMRERMVHSDSSFSLNMNVNTVLSPQFRRFDETIPTVTRGKLVIEMQVIDVFADLGAYLFARDYLQERGYRVCLDGLTHLTLRYIDRAKLGADLVKLYWMPEGVNTMDPNMMAQFKALVAQSGQARTILCRCEDEFALEFGRTSGIMMFQGYYIERMLAKQREEGLNTQTALPAPKAVTSPPELRAQR
ncbi:MAG: hypothetical protein AB7G06_05280 [Bdellovibrionales bacterium]